MIKKSSVRIGDAFILWSVQVFLISLKCPVQVGHVPVMIKISADTQNAAAFNTAVIY